MVYQTYLTHQILKNFKLRMTESPTNEEKNMNLQIKEL